MMMSTVNFTQGSKPANNSGKDEDNLENSISANPSYFFLLIVELMLEWRR